ncbi:MAG: spore germination protein [Lachnospiraceae bacterium]|nr:spore germination protein [Lachnospiraceae bacterium]
MAYHLTGDFQKDSEYFNRKLGTDVSFDVIFHPFVLGGRKAGLYQIDGTAKDSLIERILAKLLETRAEEMPAGPGAFVDQLLPYGQVSLLKEEEEIVTTILMGMPCLLIEGYREVIVMDLRSFPERGVDEPEKDRVMRGSRDGFSERLTCNTALIRRRIRDPRLRMEKLQVGKRSHTDVALIYVDDRVDKELLGRIKDRLNRLEVDALSMNQESLAECLFPYKWCNPFPKFKFSERPDTTAAHLLEGNLVVLVDNSPSAMILPASVFDIVEQADDYYFPPLTGTYLRMSRFMTALVTLFLTPLFLLFVNHPQWLPGFLQFTALTDPVNIPVFWQLLILEFAVDGMRLAALSTPNMLSTPLSIIAGISMGEYAVSSGWFNAESMLYMAFVTVANYTQTSFELGYALKFMRLILLILTELFSLWGMIGGLIFIGIVIAGNKTIAGKSYIYPLLPFSWSALKERLFRRRISFQDSKNH